MISGKYLKAEFKMNHNHLSDDMKLPRMPSSVISHQLENNPETALQVSVTSRLKGALKARGTNPQRTQRPRSGPPLPWTGNAGNPGAIGKAKFTRSSSSSTSLSFSFKGSKFLEHPPIHHLKEAISDQEG